MAGFGLALVLTPLENLLSRWRVTKLILPVLGMGGGLLLHAQLLTAARFPDILVQTPVERPGWIRVLQDDETPGAVVHMPTDLQGREQLLFQSQHERPLMGYIDFVTGFNARLPHGQVPLSFSDALYGLQCEATTTKSEGIHSGLRPGPKRSCIVSSLSASAVLGSAIWCWTGRVLRRRRSRRLKGSCRTRCVECMRRAPPRSTALSQRSLHE